MEKEKNFLMMYIAFEGEYKNDKRNGKGKEYYKIFLFNQKQENKQNKYKNKSKLLYEGEYLNGERNGLGKEYDYFNSELKFVGEYKNGKRNGKGKEFEKEKLIFEGKYLNGKRI